jgi:hypothetical protein
VKKSNKNIKSSLIEKLDWTKKRKEEKKEQLSILNERIKNIKNELNDLHGEIRKPNEQEERERLLSKIEIKKNALGLLEDEKKNTLYFISEHDKDIENLERICLGNPQKHVRVSEHCIIRYLERKYSISREEIIKEIQEELSPYAYMKTFKIKGFVVENGVAVTYFRK